MKSPSRAGRSPARLSVARGGRGATEFLTEKGLPANIDAEKFILGSILLDGSRFADIAGALREDDFALEKHRRIFARMTGMYSRGEAIDRVTLANELLKRGELESVDGLSYLVSLDDGLPHIAHLDSYVRIIRDKAALRRIAIAAQYMMTRALLAEEDPAEVLKAAESILAGLRTDTAETGRIDDLPPVGALQESVCYIREPELPEGAIIALTGNSGSGKSTLATAWARDAIAAGRPVLILDRENPRSVVADRMLRLGLNDSPLLRWAGGWIGQDAPGPDAEAVIAWVRACAAKPLVSVDSLAAFLDGDENSATDMRRFMHFCRRLADAGACVVIIHHDGKADTAKDFRGSSDFKSAVDQAFHTTNVSSDLRLDRIRLRCFKSRFGFCGELVYRYDCGKVTRDESVHAPARAEADQFAALLRLNPGITSTAFEDKAAAAGLGRNRARAYINDGVLTGFIIRKTGRKNAQMHALKEGNDEHP
jgi:hypothetical protein